MHPPKFNVGVQMIQQHPPKDHKLLMSPKFFSGFFLKKKEPFAFEGQNFLSYILRSRPDSSMLLFSEGLPWPQLPTIHISSRSCVEFTISLISV